MNLEWAMAGLWVVKDESRDHTARILNLQEEYCLICSFIHKKIINQTDDASWKNVEEIWEVVKVVKQKRIWQNGTNRTSNRYGTVQYMESSVYELPYIWISPLRIPQFKYMYPSKKNTENLDYCQIYFDYQANKWFWNEIFLK